MQNSANTTKYMQNQKSANITCKYKMQIPLKSVKYLPCICLRTTWVWAAVTIPTTISRLSSPSQSSITNVCRRPLVTGCTQCALWDRNTRASPFPKWWGWRVSSLSWFAKVMVCDGFCGPWGDAIRNSNCGQLELREGIKVQEDKKTATTWLQASGRRP